MSEKKKNTKLTLHDAFLAVFYLIIIYIGVNLCMSHGADVSDGHLVAVTISVWGILGLKLHKYRKNIKEHAGDLVFVAILALLALFAIITTVIF